MAAIRQTTLAINLARLMADYPQTIVQGNKGYMMFNSSRSHYLPKEEKS